MKYKKNKLNEIASAIQDFNFLAKFGLVLIDTLKVYRKKSSSISLRKSMFNSLLAFFFWKACTFSSFQMFFCWKSRNYSQQFSVKFFFWDLFISNYYLFSRDLNCSCLVWSLVPHRRGGWNKRGGLENSWKLN